jgi:beta-phosphoglucomutase-like phosphatase (HAD superfamily)
MNCDNKNYELRRSSIQCLSLSSRLKSFGEKKMKYKGIIFDFNGVLLWDSHLHEKAWGDFSKILRGNSLSSEEIFGQVHGRTNKCVLEYILNRTITLQELCTLSNQKESLYQELCLQNPEEFQLSPSNSR